MPSIVDYSIAKLEDGTLSLSLTSPAPIGGMSLRFDVMRRFGGDPFVTRYLASGFNGVSGLTLSNSGTGVITTHLYDSDFSGQPYGIYASQWRRTDSGSMKIISEGFLILTP